MGALRVVMLAVLAPLLPAQLFVVDPLGGGTHTDLQTAIDAAPAGAVIHVRGGTWGPLQITRSLTIVGENTPVVRAPYSGIGTQPPAIALQGAGSDIAVLAGLDVHGLADGFMWNQAGPGLRCAGFAHLSVLDCTVHGHEWDMVNGYATGASGIVVVGAATVRIVRSEIQASTAHAGQQNLWAPVGASAIAAASSTVVLLDSNVTGGAVAYSWWSMGAPQPGPCPCGASGSEPGRGGTGVVANEIYSSGGVTVGGAGSEIYVGVPAMPYGAQPTGAAVVAASQTLIPPTLAQGSPLRLGATHTVTFASTTEPSVFAVGSPLGVPATVAGLQLVFVDVTAPLTLTFLPVGSTSFALAVPANTQLLGLVIAEQRVDLPASGPWVVSNPTFAAVLP